AATASFYTNETDRVALLAFKSKITEDPLQVMSSWNNSLNFCEWKGVVCDSQNARVENLDLQSKRLVGSISPYLGNLTSLKFIYLQNNMFQGEIPQEVGHLLQLQHFNMTNNFLVGEIPSKLFHCSDLGSISLNFNDLTGKIPPQLGSLSKLIDLSLFSNSLTGGIPPSLGNLSNLRTLSLGSNSLEGRIPDSLSRLKIITYFGLGDNKLSGVVPQWLYNLSSLTDIVIPANNFSGSLPFDISFSLPNLHILAIASNKFTGHIPASLSNSLDISDNNFAGPFPINFGGLDHLWFLNLGGNHLGHGKYNDFDFFTSLTNCSNLQRLGLDENNFGGMLPNSVTNLSTQMKLLAIGGNQIVGSIPLGFENLFNLALLGLENNFFTGRVPQGIGELKNLQQLVLNKNKLSGKIPSSLGNLTQLYELYLQQNNFTENIPSNLWTLSQLRILNLSRNNLSGWMDKEVISFPSLLIKLDLAHNSLTGSIPFEIGSLKNLEELDVSENKLSGQIPTSLGDCLSLERLCMEGNLLEGNIPSSLSSLKGIQDLDLSHNNLSGRIPKGLETLSNMRRLNLSFNELEGVLEKDQTVVAVKVFNLQRKGASKSFVSECEALRNIRHRNLLQVFTSCSTVDFQGNDFKALIFELMPNGNLESWLHPSTEEQNKSRNLSLIQRLNIAIDVISAIDYLHHHSETTIIHSDLKPSNVLLDKDMTAHVGYFGLAKIVSVSSIISRPIHTNSITLKGSIGYVAPEYGLGNELSAYGDVYSYGILLLEMFTGKRPTNEMFANGLSLHEYVKMALPECVMKIVDPCLLFEHENEHDEDTRAEHQNNHTRLFEFLVSIFRIGVACSLESPAERMEVKDVVVNLCTTREAYLRR
ncbi:hypothetical protein AQUCO_00400320v1, partial [Aquilegia coerulea]